MKRILITGATGNVGLEVVRALHQRGGVHVLAGVRDVARSAPALSAYPNVQLVPFDFENEATHEAALAQCDSLFLLRPPQITDPVDALVARAKQAGVSHIVFLSVQGAEKSRFIPHHRTEQLLMASGVLYTLLRPAYFMQNFTTTLRPDTVERRRIFLPAGRARFTLIDVRDIGEVAAVVLTDPSTRHHGQAYALTARQKLNFQQMADQLTAGLGTRIAYVSPSPWRFYRTKRREGVPRGLVLVMLLLHYLPRFTAEPPVTEAVAEITGQPPTEFAQFVADYRAELLGGKEV